MTRLSFFMIFKETRWKKVSLVLFCLSPTTEIKILGKYHKLHHHKKCLNVCLVLLQIYILAWPTILKKFLECVENEGEEDEKRDVKGEQSILSCIMLRVRQNEWNRKNEAIKRLEPQQKGNFKCWGMSLIVLWPRRVEWSFMTTTGRENALKGL